MDKGRWLIEVEDALGDLKALPKMIVDERRLENSFKADGERIKDLLEDRAAELVFSNRDKIGTGANKEVRDITAQNILNGDAGINRLKSEFHVARDRHERSHGRRESLEKALGAVKRQADLLCALEPRLEDRKSEETKVTERLMALIRRSK